MAGYNSRGFNAYQIHQAMKLHFNPKVDYDYFKYNGKTRVSREKYFSDKMSVTKYNGIEKRIPKEQLELFFFVNMKQEKKRFSKFVPQMWIKEFKNFLTSYEDFANIFTKDMEIIADRMTERKYLFTEGKKNLHPLLYVWYDKGVISELTFVYIDLFIEEFVNESSSDDIIHWTKFVEEHQAIKSFYKLLVFRQDNMEEMKVIFDNHIGQN